MSRCRCLPRISRAVRKRTPISSPFTLTNSQRRNAKPRGVSKRKNSLILSPFKAPDTISRAPLADTSANLQSRRQVPSIPIITASMARSKETRVFLRSPHTIVTSRAVFARDTKCNGCQYGHPCCDQKTLMRLQNMPAGQLNKTEPKNELQHNAIMMRVNYFWKVKESHRRA
jgi:hypothetical protein